MRYDSHPMDACVRLDRLDGVWWSQVRQLSLIKQPDQEMPV